MNREYIKCEKCGKNFLTFLEYLGHKKTCVEDAGKILNDAFDDAIFLDCMYKDYLDGKISLTDLNKIHEEVNGDVHISENKIFFYEFLLNYKSKIK